MGTLVQEVSERRKKILRDILNETLSIKKQENKSINVYEHIKKFIEEKFFSSDYWTWAAFTEILTMIKWKMIDFGKEKEIKRLLKEFNDNCQRNYNHWVITDVIMFWSRLAVEYTNILEAIFNDYSKEEKRHW